MWRNGAPKRGGGVAATPTNQTLKKTTEFVNMISKRLTLFTPQPKLLKSGDD
jgi:hypothetical protein